MKKLLFCLFLIPALCFGQEKEISYEQIVPVDSLSQKEIFSKALQWFAITYRSSQDVIQLKDEAEGKIIGKGSMKTTAMLRDVWIKYTITVTAKDGKYKHTMNGFVYSDDQGRQFAIENYPKTYGGKKKVLETIETESKILIGSLALYLQKKKDDF